MPDHPSSSANLSFGQDNTFSQSQITTGDIAGRDIIHHHYPAITQPRPVVPSPVADFCGRQAERAALGAALRAGGAVIICGMGGLGKTQLTLQLASDVRDAFPDGQMLIELAGGSQAPRTPEAALRSALWTLRGPSTQLPDDRPSLQALYRATLSGMRLLVVVDDAPDGASVRSFVPPPPCTLLVNSRARITLDPPTQVVDLDLLTDAESETLLLQLAPRLDADSHTADLLAHCANLPLALRVVGNTLRERPDLLTERYLARLADETRRLGALRHDGRDVYAILGVSDTLLAEHDRLLAQRWRLLHVCPAPFDRELVAALWMEKDEDALDDAVGELLRRSLLTYDQMAECYTLHDLLRDVARQRCDAAATDEAGARHARFFCTEAVAVRDAYRRGGPSAIAALAHFDTVRVHIDAGWRWAREHTPASDHLLVDYHFAVNSYRRLRYDDTEAELYQEYQAAQRIRNLYAVSITSSMLGDLARHQQDFDAALGWYTESIRIAQQTRYPLGEAIALGNLGLVYRGRGDWEQALHYLHKGVALCRSQRDDARFHRTLVGGLINLGGVYHESNRLADALSSYEEAHQGALAIGHVLGQCIAAIGLTRVLRAGGAFRDALLYATEAFELADSLDAQDERAEAQELLMDIRTVLDAA